MCHKHVSLSKFIVMKKIVFTLTLGILLMGCVKSDNPFFETYKNKYGAPPFDKIKNEHYMPAFKEGIKQHQAEVDAIANSTEAPTFANTIEKLEFSGELLKKVSSVFFNLYSCNTNDGMEKIANEISPVLSEHNDNIFLNEKLFGRVKTIYENRTKLGLTAEQLRLLEKYHRNFIRSGAALNPEQKTKLRAINKELGLAQLAFGKNVLDETNAYQKIVTNKAELAGLPESVIQAAAEAAKEAKMPGKWLFTTQKASFIPVLNTAKTANFARNCSWHIPPVPIIKTPATMMQ